jgi:hypothetical protein
LLIVIQNFEQVAQPPSGHARAKRLPAARAHSGRREGPPHGPLPGIACWAGWIPSFPRNEQWLGRPYTQRVRPRPRLRVRTPRRLRSPPRQHRHRGFEPVLPSGHTPEIAPPQSQACSSVLPRNGPDQAATTELRPFEGSIQMDIVAFDFRKFSHDGDVLYDGMRVDVEGPGLQSAMPFDVDRCDAVRACLAPDATAS